MIGTRCGPEARSGRQSTKTGTGAETRQSTAVCIARDRNNVNSIHFVMIYVMPLLRRRAGTHVGNACVQCGAQKTALRVKAPKARKQFFSEEKNQKTFAPLGQWTMPMFHLG
jgi:hypothetical protein